MYFQKPGRNSENLEKISKKPLATLYIDQKVGKLLYFKAVFNFSIKKGFSQNKFIEKIYIEKYIANHIYFKKVSIFTTFKNIYNEEYE